MGEDMTVYIENPMHSTKKLLGLIRKFGKTMGYRFEFYFIILSPLCLELIKWTWVSKKKMGYKVNIQKSKGFLYTKNETSET